MLEFSQYRELSQEQDNLLKSRVQDYYYSLMEKKTEPNQKSAWCNRKLDILFGSCWTTILFIERPVHQKVGFFLYCFIITNNLNSLFCVNKRGIIYYCLNCLLNSQFIFLKNTVDVTYLVIWKIYAGIIILSLSVPHPNFGLRQLIAFFI